MKLDSEEAKVLFTSSPYLSYVKTTLNIIKSDNVYDVYEKIDVVYENKKQTKNAPVYFQHLKSVYDKMTESQKENISETQLSKLKQYSTTSFYKETDVRSVADHDPEDSGYLSEEEVSAEEKARDKEKLDALTDGLKCSEVRCTALRSDNTKKMALMQKQKDIDSKVDELTEVVQCLIKENIAIKEENIAIKDGILEQKSLFDSLMDENHELKTYIKTLDNERIKILGIMDIIVTKMFRKKCVHYF